VAGLVTAARTLSILPVPGPDVYAPGAALVWFPLVGGVLGLLVYGLAVGVSRLAGGWAQGAALAVALGGAGLTRGFHLDGLADWADAFGGGWTPQRALEIMKDPHVGAFGVAAVAAALLAKWTAALRLAEAGGLGWVVAAYVSSRTMMVELASALPYARPDGTGAAFVREATWARRLVALVCGAALLAGIWGPAGGFVCALSWGFARLFGLWCRRRVGGVTGDLLGACCELTETLVLLSAAIAVPWAARLDTWSGVLP
jgi:adenosylcobinamide-GDP ribazoletransferase